MFSTVIYHINTLASARIREFSEKKRLNARGFYVGISPVCSTDPVEVSKNAASLL